MLSPASLRVCCLAVMAPALTKADRRTNCLPVGLSDPFCVSKTVPSENRKDKIDPIATSASLPNKRKPPHKIWVRTNSALLSTNKNRISAIGLGTEFLNGKLRLHVEPKHKPWHGTDARTVAATKVKLKYTMNKNNSSLKNMGLAKANTSLGLHSMKRMDRISQLSHNDKRNSSDLEKEVGDNLPDLTDQTSSDLETSFSIVRIVQPALEQSIEEVSSSSRNLIASSKLETFVSLTDSDSTIPVLADTSSVTDVASDNCSAPLSPSINSTLASRDCVLPVSLPVTESCFGSSKINDGTNSKASDALAHQQSPTTPPPCDTSLLNNTIKSALSNKIDIQCKASSSTISDHILNSSTNEVNLPSSGSRNTAFADNCATESENTLPVPFDDDILPFSPASPPLSPRCDDIEAASPCSSDISSSTLSADESIPLSSMDEATDMAFITFPDSLLGPDPKPRAEVPTYGYSRVPCTTIKTWFDKLPAPGEQRNVMHYKVACCSLPKQEQESLTGMLVEQEKTLAVALKETEVLLRKYMVDHVQMQIRTLVSHLQNKCVVPCQQEAKTDKDMVDLKAELLQNEDVRSLSTAALVSLVRKLGNGTSLQHLLPSQSDSNVQDSELVTEDKPSVTFAPEDYEDIKNTSNVLLFNMKSLLRSADAEMTESSDEGSDVELGNSLEDSIQKRALWKFMKERAALTSRSTWLIARIHELENQLNTVTGVLKKVSSSIGDVPFEQEQAHCETTALSTAGSGGASLPAAKPSRHKGLGRPVNGYLDRAFGGSGISANSDQPCSRTRALKTSAFHKRKLMVTTGMHLTNPKIAKLSTVGCECNCQDDIMPCILCTGRYNCVQSVDPDALPLLERVALLDPSFHPLLSFEKDIPLHMHFENVLKKNESQYQSVRPVSPVLNSHRRMRFESDSNHYGDARSRSRKFNRYARTLLSAKYRNKKHFRKHKLVFGKWRKFQNKSTFHARDRIRRLSVASSASSHDSPVPSPCSEDGFGYDLKRRRDDSQFDIDDVIIPYSSKRGRLVKFEFKDIEIPSWRLKPYESLCGIEILEDDLSDTAFIKRHDGYEVEEKKIVRNVGGAKCFYNTWQKRSSRINHRSDSRADSSGANTPDPVLFYDQDIMFQDTNSQLPSNPPSPALSPPMTPSSVNPISDDSQPALRAERKRSTGGFKRIDEPSTSKATDYTEVEPYERRDFPLTTEMVEKMLAEDDHTRDDTDVTMSGPSCPASPESTVSSTSTVEDEDIADPEWRVALRDGPEQNIVLKFAKR